MGGTMDSHAMPGPVNPGDSFSFCREITPEMVLTFAELSGDYNPVHMDEDYCAKHNLGSTIVHGMLILSQVSTLVGMYLPGRGAVMLSTSFDFIAPARIGDILTITGRVTAKESSNMLGLDILKIRVEIKNQHDAILVRGNVRASVK